VVSSSTIKLVKGMLGSMAVIFLMIFCRCNHQTDARNGETYIQTAVSGADSLTIDSLSEYCYHSSCYFKKGLPMLGTAFFLAYHSKIYLVSALHIFTGIDPDTKKLIAGLSHIPADVWVWQNYNDRPGWSKNYLLYDNKHALFIKGSKNLNNDGFDIGAYDISDSAWEPQHILAYDKIKTADVIHVGDTVFYWGFSMQGIAQSMSPKMFIGKITETPSTDNPYITSDVFSRAGNSGAPVFNISNHRVSLIGVIARGNADANVVYITPFKESFFF
jgi:hypothetical protein